MFNWQPDFLTQKRDFKTTAKSVMSISLDALKNASTDNIKNKMPIGIYI